MSVVRIGKNPASADGMQRSSPNTVATAVPEAATWAMMLIGFALAGLALRRAMRQSDAKFDAKIKQLTARLVAGENS